MWICAKCGTEAQRPETCSGCGSAMRPFDKPEPPARPSVTFTLLLFEAGESECPSPDFVIGPFTSVMEADQWWDHHRTNERYRSVRHYYIEVMEVPS